jgi:uncharacterized membrane protein YdjX (TVP38/TMEM64 family)
VEEFISTPKNSPHNSWLANKTGIRRFIGPKRATALVALVGIFVLARYLRQEGVLSPQFLHAYLTDYPVSSAFLFTAFYAFSVVASLPTLPLNLAAGYFWGGFTGGLLATVGSSLGAACAFLAARIAFGQPLARRFDHSAVCWLQDEFDQKGWRFIAFVRLNPIFPTGVLNYLFGLSSVRFKTYLWASILFLFPPSLLFGIIGHHAGTFLVEGTVAGTIKTILVISLAITALMALRFFARLIARQKSE